MKRSRDVVLVTQPHLCSSSSNEPAVELIEDVWRLIRQLWALLELHERWCIIVDTLRTQKHTVFCTRAEWEARRNDRATGFTEWCYVPEIIGFTWYDQSVGVIHCRDALAAMGDGRSYKYERLDICLSHTDSERYNQFLNERVLAVCNKSIRISVVKVDYGRLAPVDAPVAATDTTPKSAECACCLM